MWSTSPLLLRLVALCDQVQGASGPRDDTSTAKTDNARGLQKPSLEPFSKRKVHVSLSPASCAWPKEIAASVDFPQVPPTHLVTINS